MERMRVGVIGCGAISGNYLRAAKNHPNLEVAACADLVKEAAEKTAREFSIPKVLSVEQLLADGAIDAVLNLTIPAAHAEVALKAIAAGKHVYSEKPLGVTRAEGQQVVAAAKAKGVLVGNAPDTFLGAGHQTARKLIDDGAIGKPVAAVAFMMSRGVEMWHPNPEFYYQPGGGPLFDMGPYYLTAMVNMFGPIRRVTGAAAIAIPDRTITHKDKDGKPGRHFGKKIRVSTPDHVAGLVEFDNGVIATLVMSFATGRGLYDGAHPITVYGSTGALAVPDPNGFDGEVLLRAADGQEFKPVAMTHPTGYARSAGLADLADAHHRRRPVRASGDLALAVLDAMAGILESAASGRAIEMTCTCNRPAPLPAGQPFGSWE